MGSEVESTLTDRYNLNKYKREVGGGGGWGVKPQLQCPLTISCSVNKQVFTIFEVFHKWKNCWILQSNTEYPAYYRMQITVKLRRILSIGCTFPPPFPQFLINFKLERFLPNQFIPTFNLSLYPSTSVAWQNKKRQFLIYWFNNKCSRNTQMKRKSVVYK